MRVHPHSCFLPNIFYGQNARTGKIPFIKLNCRPSVVREQKRGVSSTTNPGINTKSYTPSSISAALSNPSTLSAEQQVLIGPATYKFDEDAQKLFKLPEPWDPLNILYALEQLPKINSITVDMDHLVFHSATSNETVRYKDSEKPEHILDALGLQCHCLALCMWSIPSLPKTTIQQFPVRKLVHESSEYGRDKGKWKTFVADQGPARPELMAFDYTSEFYSRDVCDPERYEGSCISMGLFGQGNYVCGSISKLSMLFSQCFMANKEYFSRKPQEWRPDLYENIRKRYGVVSSLLQRNEEKVARMEIWGPIPDGK